VEEGDGGGDDRGVDGGLVALVGEDEGDAEEMADESGDAAGGAQEQFAGVPGDETRRCGGDGEGMVEHAPKSSGSAVAESWV
jgi:hypothetical protein